MAAPVAPLLRTPFTDMFGITFTAQWVEGLCADLEMQVVDCLDAYGLDRGIKKCDALIQDFKECATRDKQNKRTLAMVIERERQYWTGERTKENRYAVGPKSDSF